MDTLPSGLIENFRSDFSLVPLLDEAIDIDNINKTDQVQLFRFLINK